jgi:2,3-bisphosphoglycerate-independent phosphoglycerate mutase
VYVSNSPKPLKNGILADIAPTLLALMQIDKPQEMTGHSLLE